jgi:hypothetical protein
VEYSRVSEGNRLTLVIDYTGTVNQVYVAESACTSLDGAAENLRAREGCKHVRTIGRLLRTDPAPTDEPKAAIHAWLGLSQYDGVAWTALSANFRERAGSDFTISSALSFLGSLVGAEKEKAYRYFIETPDCITTKLRMQARWPAAAAVHEAGHFVLAIGLDRPVTRLSRVPVDDRPGHDPTIGCVYAHVNETQPVLLAGDLAGAWAQITVMPESVASVKLPVFRNGVVRPRNEHALYSWTGWAEDLGHACTYAAFAPAEAAGRGLPSAEDIVRLDHQVGAFFSRPDARAAIELVSHALLANDTIRGHPLTELGNAVRAILPPATVRAAILAGF